MGPGWKRSTVCMQAVCAWRRVSGSQHALLSFLPELCAAPAAPAALPQVTPITVGPLPAQFVADIVSTRSALMGRMGVDNLDSWDEEAGGGASASAGGARQAGAEAGSSSGAGGGAGSGLSPEAAAQAMSQHKAAVLSLLRQRLGRQRDGKGGSAAAKSGAPPAAAEEPAATDAAQAVEAGPADDAVTEPAGGAGSPSRAIPCGTPQQAAQPAGSYVSEGTPFGTPFSILPSLLRGPGGSEGGGAADGDAGRAAAAGGEHEEGPLLPPKREGSAVLLGTASQGEGGDGDHLFQLE